MITNITGTIIKKTADINVTFILFVISKNNNGRSAIRKKMKNYNNIGKNYEYTGIFSFFN